MRFILKFCNKWKIFTSWTLFALNNPFKLCFKKIFHFLYLKWICVWEDYTLIIRQYHYVFLCTEIEIRKNLTIANVALKCRLDSLQTIGLPKCIYLSIESIYSSQEVGRTLGGGKDFLLWIWNKYLNLLRQDWKKAEVNVKL